MEDVAVQFRIQLRLQDVLEHAELRFFLSLERLGIAEHLTVAVSEDVRGVPSADAQHSGLESGSQHGLEERLPGFEILAAYRRTVASR